MKIYQIDYLTESEKEQASKAALKVESLVQAEGGILIGERKSRKTKLGYEIKKKKMATLVSCEFQLDPAKLKGLEEEIKKMPEVLRFIILRGKRKREKISQTLPEKSKKKIEKSRAGKVGLKEIEEKLEKILDESQ